MDDEEIRDTKKPIIIRNSVDLQRLKLEKLMANPEKPVIIPERPKEKGVPTVPDFVRNVMGSSAGAGSGEFHVYRHLRRKEYARQKYMKEKAEREKMDEDYHKRIEQNKLKTEERTAKKRLKRLKKKKQKKNVKKAKLNQENSKTESSSSEESEEECSESNTSGSLEKTEKVFLIENDNETKAPEQRNLEHNGHEEEQKSHLKNEYGNSYKVHDDNKINTDCHENKPDQSIGLEKENI